MKIEDLEDISVALGVYRSSISLVCIKLDEENFEGLKQYIDDYTKGGRVYNLTDATTPIGDSQFYVQVNYTKFLIKKK